MFDFFFQEKRGEAVIGTLWSRKTFFLEKNWHACIKGFPSLILPEGLEQNLCVFLQELNSLSCFKRHIPLFCKCSLHTHGCHRKGNKVTE